MVYEYPIRSDELYHFGIKGMRWGVRRYQNPDGSLTAAGRKRYGSRENFEYQRALNKEKRRSLATVGIGAAAGTAAIGASAASQLAYSRVKDSSMPEQKKSILDKDIKSGKGKEDLSLAEVVTKNTQSSVDSAANFMGTVSDIQKRNMQNIKNPELERQIKSMSNKELQERINRINLEQRYRDLNTPDITTGAEKAKEILLLTGQTVAIAGGIIGIASAIHKWNK